MKTNDELHAAAETIRDETTTGQNTAIRVGSHLVDAAKRQGRGDIKYPDANAKYKAVRPCVTFKFDDIAGDHSYWPKLFQAYSQHRITDHSRHGNIDNAPDIPGTLAFPSEWPKTTSALLTSSTLTCDNATRTITDSNPPEGGLDSIFEWNMVISLVSSGANNDRYFVIQSVTTDTITLYPAANDFCLALLDESGHEISIYRGRRTTSTWAQIKEALDLGWTVAGHGRTHRAIGYRSGFPHATPAEIWDEVYTSRLRLNEKLTEITGVNYDVRHMVTPFGHLWSETPIIMQQAGWYSNNSYSFTGVDYEFIRGPLDPWHCDEENSHDLVDFDNALAGTASIIKDENTIAGTSTQFLTDFAKDDLVVVTDFIKQIRTAEAPSSDTALEVTEAFKQTATGCNIYVGGFSTTLTGTVSITAGGTTVTGTDTAFLSEIEAGNEVWIAKNRVFPIYQLRRITNDPVSSDTSLTVDSAFDYNITDGHIYNCANEVAGDGFDIGNIKYIAANNGWYQFAQHGPYTSEDYFYRSVYAAALDLIDYLNEDGADIVIRDRDAAYDIHRPVMEAGTKFAVGHNGVMIREAKGRNLTITDQGAIVIGCPVSTYRADNEDITQNRFTFWLDEANNKLKFRVRYSDRTLKEGEIALTDI